MVANQKTSLRSMVDLKTGFSLRPFNTFGMDVVAQYYSEINEEDDLRLITAAEPFRQGVFVLGGGSNVLFTRDVTRWVLHNKIRGIDKINEDKDQVWIRVAAGEVWHEFVGYCVANHYAGVENLSLIPGSVGAAPIQNIGAYGVEVKEVVDTVRFFNFETNVFETLSAKECAFGYRDSIFKRELKNKGMITSVTFRLNKAPVYHITYGTIRQELKKMGVETLSLQAVSDAVIKIRRNKLPDPKIIGNAGSFFKNPEVTTAYFEQLQRQHPGLPGYDLPHQRVKIPAAWLIEQCGWKGLTRDNYGVHKRQPLVMVNYGGAEGKKIYELSESIVQSVRQQFGITLQREVQIL